MDFNLQIPKEMILVDRNELRSFFREVVLDIENDRNHEVLTIQEAAAYMKVSVPTIRNLIASRQIPYFKNGQIIRIPLFDLKEWIRYRSNSEKEG